MIESATNQPLEDIEKHLKNELLRNFFSNLYVSQGISRLTASYCTAYPENEQIPVAVRVIDSIIDHLASHNRSITKQHCDYFATILAKAYTGMLENSDILPANPKQFSSKI